MAGALWHGAIQSPTNGAMVADRPSAALVASATMLSGEVPHDMLTIPFGIIALPRRMLPRSQPSSGAI